MPQRQLSEKEFNAVKDRVMASLPADMTEDEFNRVVGPRMEAALGEAESLTSDQVKYGTDTFAMPTMERAGRLLSNVGEMLNPLSIAKGLGSAVIHPIDTLTNIGAASVAQGQQAVDLAKQGRYWEAAGHAGAMLPVVGPAAAAAGEQIASGDVAGGIGKGVGLVIPAAAPAIARVGSRVMQAVPESVAAGLEAGAAKRVVDVIAPKLGQNKLRFGGMAENVAPALAKDIAAEGAPWTRQGLHDIVGGKLDEAASQLDAVSDARLNARTFPTQPLIDDLLAKRKRLTSEAVEASQPEQAKTVRQSTLVDESGKPIQVTESRTVPLGQDVVPAPNSARVAQIDQAIAELRKLGPVARYEPLRVMRQSYDGPAKAVYSPSITADYMAKMGEKLGAADITGTLRDSLARMDPETAAANGPYSLYKSADDVLEATREIQRSRPKVGRQIFSRMSGMVGGEMAGGTTGAVAGFVLAPIIDNAVAGGATTQLKTAALMQKLAGAIRRGDIGYVNSLQSQLKRLGATAARQIGGATNPSESQSQTTAPALSTP